MAKNMISKVIKYEIKYLNLKTNFYEIQKSLDMKLLEEDRKSARFYRCMKSMIMSWHHQKPQEHFTNGIKLRKSFYTEIYVGGFFL